MKDTFTAIIAQAPQTPGVYVMRSNDGCVIYVGKSINIRKRLLQHLASLNAEWQDRNYRWIFHVSDLSWYETGSELYALLLEDQLIKKHWPVGNVRQKEYLEYAWLAFSVEAIPRLLVIDARQREQYDHVFGPFHDIYHAQDMAELVQARFRLRTCLSVREGGCTRWEIRKCFAPCRSREAAERYLRTIDRAVKSLSSHDTYFIRFIESMIKRHSQKQTFEKAAHYHTMLHRYQAFINRQQFLERFRRHGLLIRENGRWPNTFYFLRGRLIGHDGGTAPIHSLFEDSEFHQSEWRVIDRAHVIWQWMRGRRSECAAAIIDERFFRNSSNA